MKGTPVKEAVAIAEAKMLMQGGTLLWLRPGKKDASQVELFE